jgi:hypothetical protein
MVEDALGHLHLHDEGDELHPAAALGAREDVDRKGTSFISFILPGGTDAGGDAVSDGGSPGGQKSHSR